jgi:hypothetical protein
MYKLQTAGCNPALLVRRLAIGAQVVALRPTRPTRPTRAMLKTGRQDAILPYKTIRYHLKR